MQIIVIISKYKTFMRKSWNFINISAHYIFLGNLSAGPLDRETAPTLLRYACFSTFVVVVSKKCQIK